MTEGKKRKKPKANQKRCPFDRTLECKDCRFYIAYEGGGGKHACVFLQTG